MGCFAFTSAGKKKQKEPRKRPASGTESPAPTSSGGETKSKASSASTPTRSIQELSEERGAQRLRVFGLEELGSATNGFSRALKVGEGGFGSVYRAFFRSAGAGGRVVLAVKRLNQRSLQVRIHRKARPDSLVVYSTIVLCDCSEKTLELHEKSWNENTQIRRDKDIHSCQLQLTNRISSHHKSNY